MLPYQIQTTNDLLTSRAGLICIAQLMNNIGFAGLVDRYFPHPQSNRGFEPSVFVTALVIMLHEGGSCLDDLRHIRKDGALTQLLSIKVPESDSMGDWLRRVGLDGVKATEEINKPLLQLALHDRRSITLDIDATLSASQHRTAEWTYKKCTGYMPIVGHVAETGQVVATDFRAGNIAPATQNLEFIHQCEKALPAGVRVSKLRVDAAGYQVAILDECINRDIQFAIRAKMNQSLKAMVEEQSGDAWQPLLDRQGREIQDESTCRFLHSMNQSQHAFTVIVQRKKIHGQFVLDLKEETTEEIVYQGEYMYRAIATNRDDLSQSELVHWYNQRGETSENRIKELKLDFGANRMPCNDFAANALYFSLCALAYNLFALMRLVLPVRFESCRAKTIRWRLYALAGKVVMHGRKLYLKVKSAHRALLEEALSALGKLACAP
mgnify:CR=1 FL=1